MPEASPAYPPYATTLNPFRRETSSDPYPIYAELRRSGPIVWMESLGVWGVFRDSFVRQVVTDWNTFGSKGGGGISNYYRETPWREPSVIFEVDPPDHTKTRAILTRILSPGAIAKLRVRFQQEADKLVSEIVARGSFDAAEDFAKVFPLKVMPDSVGLPVQGREKLLAYGVYMRKGRGHRWQHGWTDDERQEAEDVVGWVSENCSREALTKDGFGAQIYEAVDAGEITEHQGNMLVRSFLSAGVETTISGIGHTLYYLASDQDQWAIVRDDPSKARAAFEEMLRFDSPAQIIARNTLRDMEFEGVKLGQYDKVLAFIASANRDPERWSDPDTYRVTRNAAGHLGLGTGIHGCVGQMVARMEATALISSLARAVDTLEITGEPKRNVVGARGFSTIPVTVSARPY